MTPHYTASSACGAVRPTWTTGRPAGCRSAPGCPRSWRRSHG